MKHGGCFDCKTTDQEVLVSVHVPGTLTSVSVCDTCKAAREGAPTN